MSVSLLITRLVGVEGAWVSSKVVGVIAVLKGDSLSAASFALTVNVSL